MSKPILFLFNGKVAKFGNSVLGTYVEEPQPLDEVTIGNQIWKSKNLAIDDGQGRIVTQTVNYGQGDVVEYYYTWEAAVRVAASVDGWHLPSMAEWNALVEAVGGSSTAGTKIKSTYGWDDYQGDSGNGDGSYGFAAFPAGYKYGGSFGGLGTGSVFWTSDDESNRAYYYTFNRAPAALSGKQSKTTYYYSVRLIKDS